MTFDFDGARKEGYSDKEILDYFSTRYPSFNYKEAYEEGYSPEEIWQHISEKESKKKKSPLQKAGRAASQFGIATAENALLPYEIATMPLSSEGLYTNLRLEDIGSELEDLYTQKQFGEWTEKDQKQLDYLQGLIRNPEQVQEQVKDLPMNIGVRGLAEKATGLDLQPEGFWEHAANWMGYLKDPKKILSANPLQVIKSLIPSKSEITRSSLVGAALDLAEQNEWGPVGKLASAVVGDIIGHGASNLGKSAIEFAKSPKEFLANKAAKLTPSNKVNLQKQIIKDFRDSGIQADLGSITDSNLVKWIQTRLSQSSLTGKAFEEFKNEMLSQIENEYKNMANQLGDAKYATEFELAQLSKNYLKDLRDKDLAIARDLYNKSYDQVGNIAKKASPTLAKEVMKIENALKPGSIKSAEQSSVLKILDDLKNDIFEVKIVNGKETKSLKPINVKDLINNKIALNDIINYETQGGTKKLLKSLVKEIDRAIINQGKDNSKFLKNYIQANKKFSDHAKSFRNKDIDKILRVDDPMTLMNKMNSVQGMKNLEKVFRKTPDGSKLFGDLKRMKFDQILGRNLGQSISDQLKLGKFSNVLNNRKNAEIIKEILGRREYKRFYRLVKNADALKESINKFYNSSQSGTVAIDASLISMGMSAVANLASGNPWPLLKFTGGIAGARKASQLMTDPEFLRLTEEAILTSKNGTPSQIIDAFEKLRPYVLLMMQ